MKKNSLELKKSFYSFLEYLEEILIDYDRLPTQDDILFYGKEVIKKTIRKRFSHEISDNSCTEIVNNILNENYENGFRIDKRTLTLLSGLYRLNHKTPGWTMFNYFGGSYKTVDQCIYKVESMNKEISDAQEYERVYGIKPVLGAYEKQKTKNEKKQRKINQKRLARISKQKIDESYKTSKVNNTQMEESDNSSIAWYNYSIWEKFLFIFTAAIILLAGLYFLYLWMVTPFEVNYRIR